MNKNIPDLAKNYAKALEIQKFLQENADIKMRDGKGRAARFLSEHISKYLCDMLQICVSSAGESRDPDQMALFDKVTSSVAGCNGWESSRSLRLDDPRGRTPTPNE